MALLRRVLCWSLRTSSLIGFFYVMVSGKLLYTNFWECIKFASIRIFRTDTATATIVSPFFCQELTTVNDCCLVLIMM